MISFKTDIIAEVMKEDKLQPFDFTVYLLMKKEGVKVENYESVVDMFGVESSVWVSRVTHDTITTSWIVGKVFNDGRRSTERKTAVTNSIKNLIDYGLVLCVYNNDDINLCVKNGDQYLDLANKEEKCITLYFPLDTSNNQNYTLVPERYLNQTISSYKKTKNGRTNSIGYYVLFVATIFSHLYYRSVPDGSLLLEIEECYLTPQEMKYFTSKKYLWEKIDLVLNGAGILHQFKRMINPDTNSIITNQYFGVGSEESLNCFVKEKIKSLKDGGMYTDDYTNNNELCWSAAEKNNEKKASNKPKHETAKFENKAAETTENHFDIDVFDDKPLSTEILIKPTIEPATEKIIIDPTSMSEEQCKRLKELEKIDKQQLTDEELMSISPSLVIAKQQNERIKNERWQL